MRRHDRPRRRVTRSPGDHARLCARGGATRRAHGDVEVDLAVLELVRRLTTLGLLRKLP